MSLNSCQIWLPAEVSEAEASSLLGREVSVNRGVKSTPAFNGDFLLSNRLEEKWKGRKVVVLGFVALHSGVAPPSSGPGGTCSTQPTVREQPTWLSLPMEGLCLPRTQARWEVRAPERMKPMFRALIQVSG